MTTEAPANTPTANDLRGQVAKLTRRGERLQTEADGLALEGVTNAAALAKYRGLIAEADQCAAEARRLTSAVTIAERREAEAQARADAQARAEQEAEYQRLDGEARQWVAQIVATLPDAATLTQANAMRTDLIHGASALGRRRVYDPLDEIKRALEARANAIARSRHAHAPIVLTEVRPDIVEAQARVTQREAVTK